MPNPPSSDPMSEARPTAPPPPMTAMLVPPPPHRPKPLGLIVGLVALVLLLGGGTTYLAFFREAPMKTLEKAAAQFENIKAVDFRSTLAVSYDEKDLELLGPAAALAPSPENKDFDEIIVGLDGRFDWMDESALKHAAVLRFITRKDDIDTERFGLETRGLGEVLYAKLGMMETPKASFIDLSSVKDRWIRIDIAAIREQFKALIPSTKDASPEDTPEKATKSLTDAQKIELMKAFREGNVITGLSVHPNENIDGVSSKHFTLQIDENALRAFLDRAADIVGHESSAGRELETASEKTDDVLRISTVDVWISRRDGTFKRIRMPMEDPKERKNPDGTPAEKKVKVIADVVFNSFNQPVVVEEPTDAKDIMEVFQEIMGSMEEGGVPMLDIPPVTGPVGG